MELKKHSPFRNNRLSRLALSVISETRRNLKNIFHLEIIDVLRLALSVISETRRNLKKHSPFRNNRCIKACFKKVQMFN
jgi:hypothetical protein